MTLDDLTAAHALGAAGDAEGELVEGAAGPGGRVWSQLLRYQSVVGELDELVATDAPDLAPEVLAAIKDQL